MSDAEQMRTDDEVTMAMAGVLCVSRATSGKHRVRMGASAGWGVPRGILRWEHEVALIVRADATAALAGALRGTLPHEQIAPKRYPFAARAAEASPLVAVAGPLAADVRKQGVRVHTVGVDHVSSGFYYFAEGGTRDPVRVQGSLIDMLVPSLQPSTTNAEIEALLDGLIDRLLTALSDGILSELDVELADGLPRLSRDGKGLDGTNLDAFEEQALALATRSQPFAEPARRLASVLAEASRGALTSARVPLYGEARREARAPLEVLVNGKLMVLPAETMWTVTGAPRADVVEAGAAEPVAPTPPTKVADGVNFRELPVAATAPTAAEPTSAASGSMPTSPPQSVDPLLQAFGDRRIPPETPAKLTAAVPHPTAPAEPDSATPASLPGGEGPQPFGHVAVPAAMAEQPLLPADVAPVGESSPAPFRTPETESASLVPPLTPLRPVEPPPSGVAVVWESDAPSDKAARARSPAAPATWTTPRAVMVLLALSAVLYAVLTQTSWFR